MEELRKDRRALPGGYVLCGKYLIEHVIGEGGFGITYSGIRRADGMRVAVKEYFPSQYASREDGCADANLHIFLQGSGSGEPQFDRGLRYFKREAEILKKYSYLEGIVTVLDACETNNTAYIVMEFVEGITLAQYIRENGVFSYAEIVRLLTPIMKSLAQIHRQGVIHRDISPENIQIGLDDRFYLLDFGAAKQLDGSRQQNTVIFKHGYAPPEQYTVEKKQGPWTDVYALAATIYTALTGGTPVNAVQRMQSGDKLDIESGLTGLAAWQRKALCRGLALGIADRYQNMETFLVELTVEPASEEQKTVMAVADTSVRGKNRKLVVAAVIVVMIVGCIVTAGILRMKNADSSAANTAAAGASSEEATGVTAGGAATDKAGGERSTTGETRSTTESTVSSAAVRTTDATTAETTELTTAATTAASTEAVMAGSTTAEAAEGATDAPRGTADEYDIIETPGYEEIGLD